jgi:hypothetical protein
MSFQQDIEFHCGDWVIARGKVWSDKAKTIPKNLIGGTVEARIGKQRADELIFRVSNVPTAAGSFAAVSNGAEGEIEIHFRPGDTENLEPRLYRWNVLVYDAASKPNTVTDGRFLVKNVLPTA